MSDDRDDGRLSQELAVRANECADCICTLYVYPGDGWPECGPICHACVLKRYRNLAEEPDRVEARKLRDELFYLTGRLEDAGYADSAEILLRAQRFVEKMTAAPRSQSRVAVEEMRDRAKARREAAKAERKRDE